MASTALERFIVDDAGCGEASDGMAVDRLEASGPLAPDDVAGEASADGDPAQHDLDFRRVIEPERAGRHHGDRRRAQLLRDERQVRRGDFLKRQLPGLWAEFLAVEDAEPGNASRRL